MCALFGIINYKHLITKRQCQVLFNRLAAASEVRGTDASGNCVCKKWKAGHLQKTAACSQNAVFCSFRYHHCHRTHPYGHAGQCGV